MPSATLPHDAMAARVERGEFPGIVTLVARGDEVVVDAIGVTRFGGADAPGHPVPHRVDDQAGRRRRHHFLWSGGLHEFQQLAYRAALREE